MIFLVLFFQSLILSTILFIFINSRYGVGLKLLFTDNLIITIVSAVISSLFNHSYLHNLFYVLILNTLMVPILLILTVLIRSFRVPHRKKNISNNSILSPVDGHVVFIKRFDSNQISEQNKDNEIYTYDELTNFELVSKPFWIIRIKITPFDVHRTCSPISGEIFIRKHTSVIGQKEPNRISAIIDNGKTQVGVVQILPGKTKFASIYFTENETISQGEWFSAIRFGSCIDILIPNIYQVELNINDQVYAGQSLIAELR